MGGKLTDQGRPPVGASRRVGANDAPPRHSVDAGGWTESGFENLGKRLVKSPKVYLRDSGILHFLLGLAEMEDLAAHPRYGASWEGFALEQTLIAHGEREAYFYATQRGAELDLMLLRRGRRWGFEFQCTDAPRTTKSMHVVIEDLGLSRLWILYPGDREYPLTDAVTALPLKNVHDLRLRPGS